MKSIICKDSIKPLFLASFLFFCTTGIVSSHFIAICMILIIVMAKGKGLRITTPFQIILIIVALSFLNEVLYILISGNAPSLLEIIPYSIFIFITMWAAQIVDERVLKWMMWFTLIDIGAAVIQRVIGVNTFLPENMTDAAEMGGELLYDLKVNGLNTNSSGLAYKAFLALLIHERFPKCRLFGNYIWYIICLAGIVLAFNRTMLLAFLVYFSFKLLRDRKKGILIPLVVLICFLVLSLPDVMEFIITQLTRGNDSFSAGNATSGREEIYAHYIYFCKEHFFFGNGSFKYYMGEGIHAHNSFLQTMATNGLIITALYVLFLLSTIKKTTWIYALPIFVCALTQSFILWGASYNDFVFYCIMLKPVTDIIQEHQNLKTNKYCIV